MKIFFKATGIALAVFAGASAFAESAPVYDVDSLSQQQFEGAGNDQVQDFPQQAQDNAFIPADTAQTQSPAAVSVQAPPPPVASNNVAPVNPPVNRHEDGMSNLQVSSSQNRVESLQNEVQTLRGQVEELTHQLQQLQAQQKTMYSDLDKRISTAPATKAVEPAPAVINNQAASTTAVVKPARKVQPKIAEIQTTTPVAAAPAKANNQPNVQEEQEIYQTAYTLIKAKKYSEAVETLQKMLQKYPSGQFASNAHYWLGELYGLMGKNDQALTEFDTVVKTFPESPRVSDAQLKVGLIYASQLKWPQAKTAFKKVINHYPGTASSRLAAEQLKEIKQAGH